MSASTLSIKRLRFAAGRSVVRRTVLPHTRFGARLATARECPDAPTAAGGSDVDLRVLFALAEQQQRAAERLRQLGLGAARELLRPLGPLLASLRKLHLDELVIVERLLHRGDHPV